MTDPVRSRPLRIAYVTGSLGLGGSERQMLMLASHLDRRRFQVEFILLGQPGILAADALAAGIRVHALRGPPRHSASPPVWAFRVLVSIARFVRLARRRRYDVVDAWLFGSYALAAVTRPLTRVPVLVAGRRSLSDYKERFTIPQRAAEWIARRWSDAVVANAYAVADDVRAREGLRDARLRVIRNGVELAPALDQDERRATRSAWGADADDSIVIGCVANYKRGKGLEDLVASYADVVSACASARLVLVGEGPLRGKLERMLVDRGLEGRAVLAGRTADPRGLYAAFDIAVLASETEGLPNVLLEAAAAGRPLVATDAGASREIVIDGETGILVPIGDRVALTEALVCLARDADLRGRYGEAARTHAIRDFGVDRCVAEFAALYEGLATAAGVGDR
jgi:glycosyltransferase involved in cell wall biosynthesis